MVKIKELRTEEINENEEYKKLIPRPTKEEYTALLEDIRENGIKCPIVVNNARTILDGYTRFKIAQELEHLKIPAIIKTFDNGLEEKYEVITLNLHRRHLITAQRTWLGIQLLEIEKERAKTRQGTRTDLLDETLRQNFHKVKGRTRDVVAEKVGVSGKTIDKGRKIIEVAETDQEVKEAWEKARAGKKSLESVYSIVKKKQVAEAGEPETAEEKPPEPEPEVEQPRPTIKEETVIANTQLKDTAQQTLDLWLYEDDKGKPFLKFHGLTLDSKQTKQLYKFLKEYMEKA